MAKNWKVIHIKSRQHGETPDSPKLPTSEQLEYGEIAINYGAGIETIAIRNENDEIVRFVPESKMREYVDERIREVNYFLLWEDTYICLRPRANMAPRGRVTTRSLG